MIDRSVSKSDCVGCEACIQACPKNAISAIRDNEGFIYPSVNNSLCVECGVCLRKCQVLNPRHERYPLNIYWAYNKDLNTKVTSSSGGLFAAFAEYYLSTDGYVFGASFDADWSVSHCVISDVNEIDVIKRSKYVQSRIGNCYRDVLDLLIGDKSVLFCGTPCEISGLYSYLGREYEKLATVEIVCHGTPSPKVWTSYIRTVCNLKEIGEISFRDKTTGWADYSFMIKGKDSNVILKESRYDNVYVRGFLKNLYLRPSCYNCKNKRFSSGADLTLGDFWGVGNTNIIHDGKGISLCYINTAKGYDIFKGVSQKFECCELVPAQFDNARVFRGAVSNSAPMPDCRDKFWSEYEQAYGDAKNLVILKYSKDSFWVSLRRNIRNVFPFFVVNFVKRII